MEDGTFARLQGLRGVVTGGARGIGQGCAAELVGHGANVVVADLDGDLAAAVADGLSTLDGGAVACELDVRSWDSVERAVARCSEAFGGIDFVVANAGIGDYSALDTGDPERWRRVIETNLLGVLHTVRAALPAMKAQGSGDIVLMASIAGRWTWVGEPVYIAAKWGVVGLGWALRKEALDNGVRVTMIEPGMVDTPLVRATPEGRSELERYATLQIDDVARAVAFALSQPAGVAISELMINPVGPEL
jgi:NADP-dependent 3-hydroxy acid dehydrogenase YdfG